MGDSENEDDPFETYLGTTDEPEDDDPAGSWSWPSEVFTRPVWAVAAIVLATASLLGMGTAEILSRSVDSAETLLRNDVVAPSVQAGFAAIAILFGLLALRPGDEGTPVWARTLAAAAIVVAVLAMAVNLAGVGAALNSPGPAGIFSDDISSAPSDVPIFPTDAPSGFPSIGP